VPTVTASTMIADLELADKVGCHNGPVEILEAARSEGAHLSKTAKGGAASVGTAPAVKGGSASPLSQCTQDFGTKFIVWLSAQRFAEPMICVGLEALP
jgi:hypothetical protein